MKFLFGLRRFLFGAAAAALALAGMAAFAGPGHDHGDDHHDDAKPGAASGHTQPRFTAASELFELVGVIDGKRLTVYLDHAATNEPVKDAKLELEIGGAKVTLRLKADGEFEAELAQAPVPGVHPVTATVGTAKDSDLLAGELDLHEDAPKPAAAHGLDLKRIAKWGGAGLLALLALAVGLRIGASRRPTTPALRSPA